MGCASSSPVVNGEGGVQSASPSMGETMAEKAKNATNEVVASGEQVLNDAGEAVTDTMEAVEDTVTDAMDSMKTGMDSAMNSGMAFMQDTRDAVATKAEAFGADMKEAGNELLMQHVPLKQLDAVEDLMTEKMHEADEMANELMNDTQDMVQEMGAGLNAGLGKAMTMVGLPSKSMDSFKTGSPEPELQKLEEMSSRTADSPKPSSNVLELVDLEATPTPDQSSSMMMMSTTMMAPSAPTPATPAMSEMSNGMSAAAETTTVVDDSHTLLDTNTQNNINLLLHLNGISTPADTLLLGEIICEDSAMLGTEKGIVLAEPTQWEKYADTIVKNHLDKALRRSGGATSAAAAAVATTNGSGGKDEDNHATEQNIEL